MYQSKFKTNLLPNGNIKVKLNQVYELKADEPYFQVIDQLVDMINAKNNLPAFSKCLQIDYFSSLEFKLGNYDMKNETCPICMDQLEIQQLEKQVAIDSDIDVYQLKCNHRFHRYCLKKYIKEADWVKCPIDNSIFGKMIGDMSEGKINVTYDKNLKCSGYNVGTHIIRYQMHSGVRDGKLFQGTARNGYIPDTPEGKQVLELLIEAFNRKLTFTIGKSVTTGLDHQIVWNGIHHKTATNGGAAYFGYPDQTYFKRVKQQLAAKGIIPK